MKYSINCTFRTVHFCDGHAVGYSTRTKGKSTHFQTISIGSSVTEHGGRIIHYRNGHAIGWSKKVSLTKTKHFDLNGKCIGESLNLFFVVIHRGYVWEID